MRDRSAVLRFSTARNDTRWAQWHGKQSGDQCESNAHVQHEADGAWAGDCTELGDQTHVAQWARCDEASLGQTCGFQNHLLPGVQ